MSTMSVSEARAALPRLLDRVSAGEEVTITRHGQAVAVIVRPDALRSRRAERVLAEAATIHDVLVRRRQSEVPTVTGLSPERAEQLIREVRAGRRR